MENKQEIKAAILDQVDSGITPASMFTMGMLSDVQHLIMSSSQLAGSKELVMALQILNDAKVVISERLATKDEHGRHDFNETEKKTNTFILRREANMRSSGKRMFKALHYMDSPRDFQWLTEEKLMQWGREDAVNRGYDIPETCEEAIDILHDIGDVQVVEVSNDGE